MDIVRIYWRKKPINKVLNIEVKKKTVFYSTTARNYLCHFTVQNFQKTFYRSFHSLLRFLFTVNAVSASIATSSFEYVCPSFS